MCYSYRIIVVVPIMQDSEEEENSGGGIGTQRADSVAEGCSVASGQGEEDMHVYYHC